MTDPTEGIKGVEKYRITETNLAVATDGSSAIDCSNCEKVVFQNQGSNNIWFTLDGTTPVAAAGNGACMLAASSAALIEVELGRNVSSIKLDAETGATNLYYRLYS